MSEMRIGGSSSSSYSTYSSSSYSARGPTGPALSPLAMGVLFLLSKGTTGEELVGHLAKAKDDDLRALKSDLDTVLGIVGAEAKQPINAVKGVADAVIEARQQAARTKARQEAEALAARQAEDRRRAEERRQADEGARREAQARQAEARQLAEARRQADEAAQREAAEAARRDAERVEAGRRERAAAAERAAAEEAARTGAATPSGKAHWYYSLDGVTPIGPVTSSDMRALIAAGELTPEHLVSPDGTKWKRASRLQGASWPGEPAG